MSPAIVNRILLSAVLSTTLAGCGGADTTASGGTGGTGISTGVITGFGSVVVNGVHFDESNASVSINDRPGSGTHKGLKVGMTVKVKGSFAPDGASGTATDIEAEHEVEGKIASVDSANQSFIVLGQTIIPMRGRSMMAFPPDSAASRRA